MRRKLGIAILGIIMALAGTQEAVQQFRGLKSSVTDWTRDSLWSGLIVYAQPVTDSSLPTPQLYYMMPQVAPCPPEPSAPMLADNVTDAVKPETKNSHAVQTANATATEAGAVEETAKTEFVLDKLPPSVVASTFDALPAELPRAFVEVAKNETFKMKLAQDVNALEAAQKDFDVERLEADAARLANDRAKFEALKMRAVVDAEKFNRRVEIKIMRRPERVRVPVPPIAERRALVLLPEISSIGCEKTPPAPPATEAAEVSDAAPVEQTQGAHIIIDVDATAAAAALTTPTTSVMGNVWSLGCDTEAYETESESADEQ